MKENLHFESTTGGLWPRFITNVIATIIFTFYILVYVLSLLSAFLSINIIPYFLIPAILWMIWKLYLQIPLNWNNTLMIDFQNKVFKISSKKLKQDELEILDYDGRQFAFEEIKSYNSQEIESVIFKAYFLVSLNIGTKEIKCLSFKDADKYVDFLKILHDLNIQMKK